MSGNSSPAQQQLAQPQQPQSHDQKPTDVSPSFSADTPQPVAAHIAQTPKRAPAAAPTASSAGLSVEVQQRVLANRAAALARRKRKISDALAPEGATAAAAVETPAAARLRQYAATPSVAQSTPTPCPRKHGRNNVRLSRCQARGFAAK